MSSKCSLDDESRKCVWFLVLVDRCPGLTGFSVFRKDFLGVARFDHKALLFAGFALFPGGFVFGGLSATVALPEENDGLAEKHADGAGGKTGQNAQDGGDNDEVHNSRESTSESTVVAVVVVVTVRSRAVAREAMWMVVGPTGTEFLSLEAFPKWWRWRGERHSVEAFFVVSMRTGVRTRVDRCVALVLAVAALATRFGHSHDAVLCRGEKSSNAGHQKFLKAFGFALAVSPGCVVVNRSGLFNSSAANEDFAGGCLDEAERDSVNGNRALLHIKNGEAEVDQIVARLEVRVVGHRHDFKRVADGNRIGVIAILVLLNCEDGSRRSRWEDLAAVGQQAVVVNEEVQCLGQISNERVYDECISYLPVKIVSLVSSQQGPWIRGKDIQRMADRKMHG